jgi:hypothetical protein
MSRKLKNHPIPPSTGSVIFATSNIVKSNPEIVISSGIKVLNVRAFGYSVPPTEMYGRMSDLTPKDTFKPVIPSSPGSCRS